MALIETQRGEIEEELLDKLTGTVDDDKSFRFSVEYRPKGEDVVIARFEKVLFNKVNPFAFIPSVGPVNVDLQDGQGIIQMDSSELDREFVLEKDNDHEYTWAMLYRLKGTDKVVHRSVDVKLKKASLTGEAIAAKL